VVLRRLRNREYGRAERELILDPDEEAELDAAVDDFDVHPERAHIR
jgi:hypothetical protein